MTVMVSKAHWESVYRRSRPEAVGWYQPHLATSLALMARAGLNPSSRVIDVGGGASTLVDDLLDRGVAAITVLDLSESALAASRARLGARAGAVQWIEGDVTQARLPAGAYELWHDRAFFHFLTDSASRRRYLEVAQEALVPAGQLILATFGLRAPRRCSGLAVVRYSPATLQEIVGRRFTLVEALEEAHRTPANTVQPFLYARFQKLKEGFS